MFENIISKILEELQKEEKLSDGVEKKIRDIVITPDFSEFKRELKKKLKEKIKYLESIPIDQMNGGDLFFYAALKDTIIFLEKFDIHLEKIFPDELEEVFGEKEPIMGKRKKIFEI